MRKYFLDNNKVISNKGMGWVIHAYCGRESVDYNEVMSDKNLDNVALLYTWNKLEPKEGEFYFDELDEAIEKYTKRNKNLHFRISTDPMIYNGAHGVPDWLFENYDIDYFERTDYGCTARFPDYLNPIYQEKLMNFLNAMAKRYGKVKNLLQIDLRGYGEWGEWHSGYMHNDLATHNEALRQIIAIWVEAFKDTNIPLVISSSYEWRADLDFPLHAPKTFEEFKYFQGFDCLEAYDNITFRRDGIGGALRVYDKQIMDEYFYNVGKLPITAEFFSPYLKTKVMPDGVRGYHTLDALEEALQIHPNYMMIMWDSNQFYQERPDLIEYGLKRMGYRLIPEYIEIDKLNKGSYITIKQKWINLAVGRLYFPCYLKLKAIDEYGNETETIDKTFMANKIIEDKPYKHSSNINLKGLSGKITIYAGIFDYENNPINLPLDDKTDNMYKLIDFVC